MKERPRRRITGTSSLGDISTDQLGNRARIFQLLRSPGIDPNGSIPLTYVAWPVRQPIITTRFLGFERRRRDATRLHPFIRQSSGQMFKE
jgi:hypothetical protein